MTITFFRFCDQLPPDIDFKLFPIDDDLPPEYRLVTVQEVEDNREAVKRVMPGWEIANLADGSVDGLTYGAHIRLSRRNDVSHNLVAWSKLLREPDTDFKLFPIDDDLPPEYRLVTVQEVEDNREAIKRAMPGWEIANLADGSVDGSEYGAHIRLSRRNDVSHNLVARSELFREPDMDFKLLPIDDALPPEYCLVTVQEVEDNREAVKRAMPGWEIANLADGSVDGCAYGAHIRLSRRNDVGHNLVARSELLRPL